MKRSLPLVLALAVAFLGIVPLTASAAMPGNYTALKLGGYFPQSDDLEEFDTGFNGEIAFGHYFTPNIAGEIGIGYFQADTETIVFFDPVLGLFTADAKLKVYPVTLNIKFVHPVQNFELYAMGGVGIYFAKLEVGASALGLVASDSDDDTAFGVNLGVGANFYITPNVYLGGEVKYLWAEPSFFDVDVKIDGIQATANIGYRF
jgi:opacity protein-like surface antigen